MIRLTDMTRKLVSLLSGMGSLYVIFMYVLKNNIKLNNGPNMKKCAALYLVTLFCIMSCSGDRDGCPVSYPTIPVPVVYEEYQGADGFPVSDGVRIVSDERIGEGNARLLAESIGRHCGSVPEVITPSDMSRHWTSNSFR